MSVDSVTERNRKAWNSQRYEAWVQAIGSPVQEAARLRADPAHKLRRLLPHVGEVRGRRICNIQGSHGRVAVALGLLGAEVTVIDFAEENRRYALDLANAAGVAVDYRLADVMESAALGLQPFDWLVMELGVLHYHHDLPKFFRTMAELTTPAGRFVLNEFHPIDRKLHQVGLRDYFASDVVLADVPDPTGSGLSLGTCAYRYWTLAEIITAAIDGGWLIDRLEEHPHWSDPRSPGTFTLVATKAR